MDLEKIEIRKKFFKNSGFRNSKTPNFLLYCDTNLLQAVQRQNC